MTGESKTIRYHANQITKKNKYKDRENKWKVGPAFLTNIITDHSCYKLVC